MKGLEAALLALMLPGLAWSAQVEKSTVPKKQQPTRAASAPAPGRASASARDHAVSAPAPAPASGRASAPAKDRGAPASYVASEVTLSIGHSALFNAPDPFSALINGNPKLVDASARSRHQLVLFGLSEGETEIRLMDEGGRETGRLIVHVLSDVGPLQSLLRSMIGPKIDVSRIGNSVVLTGKVENAGQVALAGDIALRAYGQQQPGAVVNLIKCEQSDEITVSVKVLEVKRSKLKSVGLKWSLLNRGNQGSAQVGNVFSGALARPSDQFSAFASTTLAVGHNVIDAFVDLLRSEGEARLLAEPTIVAASGKSAKFLSGGEFPVPAPSGFISGPNNTQSASSFESIIYKQFGISLAFQASILPDNRIELQVTPEVSSIDATRSIEDGGNHVPALATRRADTFLRVNSGDSVIFAGLTSQDSDKSRTRLPLGGTRALDFLAGPSSTSSDETELVIIVTPRIGAGLERPASLK